MLRYNVALFEIDAFDLFSNQLNLFSLHTTFSGSPIIYLNSEKVLFFKILALHVIEFQKRGLPHAHMVIWLHPDSKPKTIQQVDRMVSAEIPDKQQDPHGYDAVKQFMIHGPCGESHKLSPCMDSDRKTCTRHFPKRYTVLTILYYIHLLQITYLTLYLTFFLGTVQKHHLMTVDFPSIGDARPIILFRKMM